MQHLGEGVRQVSLGSGNSQPPPIPHNQAPPPVNYNYVQQQQAPHPVPHQHQQSPPSAPQHRDRPSNVTPYRPPQQHAPPPAQQMQYQEAPAAQFSPPPAQAQQMQYHAPPPQPDGRGTKFYQELLPYRLQTKMAAFQALGFTSLEDLRVLGLDPSTAREDIDGVASDMGLPTFLKIQLRRAIQGGGGTPGAQAMPAPPEPVRPTQQPIPPYQQLPPQEQFHQKPPQAPAAVVEVERDLKAWFFQIQGYNCEQFAGNFASKGVTTKRAMSTLTLDDVKLIIPDNFGGRNIIWEEIEKLKQEMNPTPAGPGTAAPGGSVQSQRPDFSSEGQISPVTHHHHAPPSDNRPASSGVVWQWKSGHGKNIQWKRYDDATQNFLEKRLKKGRSSASMDIENEQGKKRYEIDFHLMNQVGAGDSTGRDVRRLVNGKLQNPPVGPASPGPYKPRGQGNNNNSHFKGQGAPPVNFNGPPPVPSKFGGAPGAYPQPKKQGFFSKLLQGKQGPPKHHGPPAVSMGRGRPMGHQQYPKQRINYHKAAPQPMSPNVTWECMLSGRFQPIMPPAAQAQIEQAFNQGKKKVQGVNVQAGHKMVVYSFDLQNMEQLGLNKIRKIQRRVAGAQTGISGPAVNPWGGHVGGGHVGGHRVGHGWPQQGQHQGHMPGPPQGQHPPPIPHQHGGQHGSMKKMQQHGANGPPPIPDA